MFCFWCSLSSYAFLRLSYDVRMRVYAFLVFWMRSFCFFRFSSFSYAFLCLSDDFLTCFYVFSSVFSWCVPNVFLLVFIIALRFFCVLMIAYRFLRFSVWFPCDVLMVFLMIALWYYYLVLCFAYAFFVLSLCVSFCVSDVFLWFCLYFFWCPFPFFTHFIMLCLMRVFDCVLLLLWCLDVFIMRFLWLPYVVLLFSSFSYVCSGLVHPWS